MTKLSQNLIGTTLTLAAVGCTSTSTRHVASQATVPAVYSFESDASGFNTKNFFYDNGEEVVVFDTQFTGELAKKSIDFVRTKTQNPITYVVIMHPNPDKFNGMRAFQELGAKVIASQKTADSMPGVHAYKKYYFVNIAKMFTEENYPKLAKVDTTFGDSYELTLRNGETISLKELSQPGVSSKQTVAYIAARKVLVVGDMVHHKAHAWLEGGIVSGKPTPTVANWIAGLKEIQRNYPADTRVLGGRGQEASLDVAVPEQIDYLNRADILVSSFVSGLRPKANEITGANSGTHYAALTKDFERAFPDYSLSYMISYGVYGLAQSKLR